MPPRTYYLLRIHWDKYRKSPPFGPYLGQKTAFEKATKIRNHYRSLGRKVKVSVEIMQSDAWVETLMSKDLIARKIRISEGYESN